MTIQAIVRRSYTVTATFTGVPTPEERKALKAAGAEFRNGQWVKNNAESVILDAADAVKLVTA
jgi:hypothetical protein